MKISIHHNIIAPELHPLLMPFSKVFWQYASLIVSA